MAVDYTVIMSVRQRFGDNKEEAGPITEKEAPFVGRSKDFPFSCPNVDRSKAAILKFESLGVNFRGVLKVNGTAIFGGLTAGPSEINPVGPSVPVWKTHNLIVHENVLLDQNQLRVEAAANTSGNVDDFVLDNIVLFFKTRSPVVGGGGVVVT